MNTKPNQNILSEYAYNKIKLLIFNNILKSGEKIIQEKMAQHLGISKTPIIQALSILQNERLIEYYPRKGFFVRELLYKEFIDILDIRRILEQLAIKKIIENLNEKTRNELTGFLEGFELFNKTKNKEKYYELDRKFHSYLIEASGNSYLIDINNTFNILLLCYTKGFVTEISASMDDHRRIILAILEKDLKKALKFMKDHTEHKKKSHIINGYKNRTKKPEQSGL
ncbi:MAG: GntR family transcriptional regulator [Actinobacteria bacterium]|nr:GntR family transcriptional regulator [Actinomycetota bacterium]